VSDDPAPGFAWVTKCYTIENYLPADVLTAAIAQVHPKVSYESVGQWENPLPSKKNGLTFDKVGIAEAARSLLAPHHLNVLDLHANVTALRDFIRAANGHSTAPEAIE
jgi:hypothetical protein